MLSRPSRNGSDPHHFVQVPPFTNTHAPVLAYECLSTYTVFLELHIPPNKTPSLAVVPFLSSLGKNSQLFARSSTYTHLLLPHFSRRFPYTASRYISNPAVKVLNMAPAALKRALGLSPIHVAVFKGNLNTVKALIRKDQHIVDTPSARHKMMALHFAVMLRKFPIACLLLRRNASLNCRDLSGVRPSSMMPRISAAGISHGSSGWDIVMSPRLGLRAVSSAASSAIRWPFAPCWLGESIRFLKQSCSLTRGEWSSRKRSYASLYQNRLTTPRTGLMLPLAVLSPRSLPRAGGSMRARLCRRE